MNIVFMGTPEFAVPSLQTLLDHRFTVSAVVTAPDKPRGRGQQVSPTPVKEFAVASGIPVLQPETLRDPEFVSALQSLAPDLFVVVAFRILPKDVYTIPRLGAFNLHASLLPKYRGAAPINWAIINGETETGVTTFKLKHEIDTGNILLQEKVAILPEDNVGSLYEKLMKAGGELLVRTVKGFADGSLKETPQQEAISSELKHAPKIFKEDTRIDWNKPVKAIHDLVRGMSPVPAAFTMLGDKFLKIYGSHYEIAAHGKEPGEHETDGKTYFRFAAKDGWLYADDIQQEGKKRMGVEDFLRGYRP